MKKTNKVANKAMKKESVKAKTAKTSPKSQKNPYKTKLDKDTII
jgi:hypothetical protein